MFQNTTPAAKAPLTLWKSIGLVGRLCRLARSHWREFGRAGLAGVAIAVLGLVPPYLAKLLVDQAYPTLDSQLVGALVGGILVVTAVATCLDALRRYFVQSIAARLSVASGLMFLDHLLRLPLVASAQRQTGELTARSSELRSTTLSLATQVFQLVASVLQVVVIMPLLLLLNWRLTAVAVAAYPLIATISVIAGPRLRSRWRVSAEASAAVQAYQVEALSGLKFLKSAALECFCYDRAFRLTEHAMRTQLLATGFATAVGAGNSLLRVAATAGFTWYSWNLIIAGQLSLGDYLMFTGYLASLVTPVSQLTGVAGSLQHAAVASERAFELLDLRTESAPYERELTARRFRDPLRGSIEFKNVSFGYSSVSRVLNRASLHVPAGRVIALMGESGAGKSTIVHLLLRHLHQDAGEIILDGRPHTEYSPSDVRSQIGVVWQDATLFNGTLRDNLTLGLDDLNTPAIEDAVRLCRLDAVVCDSPAGLDTMVAEAGRSLSGGQRQRVAVARVLLRNTPILILDEALSQVDEPTEEAIIDDILVRCYGRTIILITHRMSIASRAQQIVVVRDGRLVVSGDPLLVRVDGVPPNARHSGGGRSVDTFAAGARSE